MEEPTIDALIDQYLMGTINPGDKARLEHLMATDPAIAGLVSDSKLAYKALLLERNRLLKEKLKKLDQEDIQVQPFIHRRLGLLFSVIGIFVLLFFLLTIYQSPQCIARRHLADYPEHEKVAWPLEENESAWHQAKTAYMENDYSKAIQLYVVLAGDPETLGHFTARWNILMAQLAAEGPTSAWHLAMEAYAREAPEPLSAEANVLSAKFKSISYKIFFSPLKDKLSYLKPRLI